jgi:hypothetical protein
VKNRKDEKKTPGNELDAALSGLLGGLTEVLDRGADKINRAAGTVKKMKKALDEPEEKPVAKGDSRHLDELIEKADKARRKVIGFLDDLAGRIVEKADGGIENLDRQADRAKKAATEIKETVDRVQKRRKGKDSEGGADDK